MIIENKEIAKRILFRLKQRRPLYFKSVKATDIERILNNYNRVMRNIMNRGGFMTLSTYRNFQQENCIRITFKEKKVVYHQYGKLLNYLYYCKRNGIKVSRTKRHSDQ